MRRNHQVLHRYGRQAPERDAIFGKRHEFILTCKELTELITDYLEGRLSLVQRLRFQLHLGLCRLCRAYIRQVRLTVRILRRLPEESLSPAMREMLLQQFKPGFPFSILSQARTSTRRFANATFEPGFESQALSTVPQRPVLPRVGTKTAGNNRLFRHFSPTP